MADLTVIIEDGFKEIIATIKENAGRGDSTDVHDLLTRLQETIKAQTGMTFEVPCLAQLFFAYAKGQAQGLLTENLKLHGEGL